MKIIRKICTGIQPVFSTNVEDTHNYVSQGNIINHNCIVDVGYEGECHINLHNVSDRDQVISAGDKIVQGIMVKIGFHVPEEVKDEAELYGDSHSERASGGFGSSGTK